jgi:pimeloyl-ACP methyl ester carboxylesterase
VAGSARGAVLLLHAGIADRRMWAPQVDVLEGAGYRVLAPDLRGFGDRRLEPAPFSHLRDAEASLDDPAVVAGNSLGGRVALELAVHRPDLVERLVLIAPGLPGWEWAEDTRAGWAAEEAAYDAGDYEQAAEESVRLWVDGAGRSPEEVDPEFRAAVTGMVLRSYEMQHGAWEAGADEEDVLDPPVGDRLDEIRCPTLVLVGEHDVEDMRAIAAHLAGSIGGARLATIAGASHLPSLERPVEVNELLLSFLGESR